MSALKILWLRRACIFLSLWPLIGFLIHPLVNLTSFEPKPRGVFVDEHGNVINSLIETHTDIWLSPPRYLVAYGEEAATTAGVAGLLGQLLPERVGVRDFGPYFAEVHVMPDTNPSSLETVAVVVPVPAGSLVGHPATVFISTLVSTLLEAPWLSKNVVLLVIQPQQGASVWSQGNWVGDTRLQHWLYDRHLPNRRPRRRPYLSSLDTGLLRETWVVDLWHDLDISSGPNGNASLPIRGLQVLSTGKNGQQANMDLTSVALMLGPRSHMRGSGPTPSDAMPHPWLFTEADALSCPPWLHMPSRSGSGPDYVTRFRGLLRHMWAAAMGPSGLHGHFLSFDVDAATLRSARWGLHETPCGDDDETTHDKKRNGALSDSLSDADVVEIVVMLLRSASNLHEELHHSLWGYTFLGGSEHFVGLPEYATNMAMLLLGMALRAYLGLLGTAVTDMIPVVPALLACVEDVALPWLIFYALRIPLSAAGEVGPAAYLLLLTLCHAISSFRVLLRSTRLEAAAPYALSMTVLLLTVLCCVCATSFAVGFPLTVVANVATAVSMYERDLPNGLAHFLALLCSPLLLGTALHIAVGSAYLDGLAAMWLELGSLTIPCAVSVLHMMSCMFLAQTRRPHISPSHFKTD